MAEADKTRGYKGLRMKLSIPGRGTYDIQHVVFDLNGTLAVDGELVDGVLRRLVELKVTAHLVVVTADAYGEAARLGDRLGLEIVVVQPGDEAEQKAEHVRRLGVERCIAVGNGANDVLMLRESAIGVCVMGPEGASVATCLPRMSWLRTSHRPWICFSRHRGW